MPTSTEREEPSDLTASISGEQLAPETLTRPIAPPAGMTTVEYLILLVLIAAVSIGVWKTFGETAADAARGEVPAADQAGEGAADNMPRSMA
jgi:Flp pilus assembly pilin Flp